MGAECSCQTLHSTSDIDRIAQYGKFKPALGPRKDLRGEVLIFNMLRLFEAPVGCISKRFARARMLFDSPLVRIRGLAYQRATSSRYLRYPKSPAIAFLTVFHNLRSW
jgi:hypothetical protein